MYNHKAQQLAEILGIIETMTDGIFEWEADPDEVAHFHAQLIDGLDPITADYVSDLLVRWLPVASLVCLSERLCGDEKTPDEWIGARIAGMVQDEITSTAPLNSRPLVRALRTYIGAGLSLAQTAARCGGSVASLEAFLVRYNALAASPVPEPWDAVYTRLLSRQWQRIAELIDAETQADADDTVRIIALPTSVLR